MKRIAYLMGLLVGVFFGAAAYVAATQTLTVGVSNITTNPACAIPILGIACGWGLIPSTISVGTSFVIQGIGLVIIETVLLFFVILAVLGLLALLLLRNKEGSEAWAWAMSGLFLGFLIAFCFAWSFGLMGGGIPVITGCGSLTGLCLANTFGSVFPFLLLGFSLLGFAGFLYVRGGRTRTARG